jgi:hypothetical protein
MSKLDATTLTYAGWLVCFATVKYLGTDTATFITLLVLAVMVVCGILYAIIRHEERHDPPHTHTHTHETCAACKERSLGL